MSSRSVVSRDECPRSAAVQPPGMDSMKRPTRVWAVALVVVSLLVAASASADAKVLVQIRSASGASVDGKVTLSPTAGGKAYTCQTASGRCQIGGVPGGRYVVRFQPNKGEAMPSRKVMIPPSGEVKLSVAAK